MSDGDPQNNELLEAINKDAGQLIHHLRCSHAPDEALAQATAHIRQAMEVLRPWLKQGEGWSTISITRVDAAIPRCNPLQTSANFRARSEAPIRKLKNKNICPCRNRSGVICKPNKSVS